MTFRVNYVYFGAFFALLVILYSSSIFTKESLGGAHLFFFLYALGQIVIEVVLLVIATYLLKKCVGEKTAYLFIGVTFFSVFLHFFDFLMDRILDLSVWEAVNVFVLEENLGNFFYLLDASGISLWVWALFFTILAALPFLGLLLYQISDRFAKKHPMIVKNSLFLQILFYAPLALLLWDFGASKVIHPDAYTSFRKSIPWKGTFLQPKSVIASLPGLLKKPYEESEVVQWIEKENTAPLKKPNIYLFITESLREDCIKEEIAPNLYQFKNDFVHFDQAISSGNGTHLSWFSIFHSEFPYHWKAFQTSRKRGSPPLQLLKKWGYKIHLYSSAQLSYYGMEELIFGEKSYLIDRKQTFHHSPPLTAADTDAAALDSLQKDLKEHPEWNEGQVFIVFWDCTHFNYCWPKDWSPTFTPFAQEFAYFRTIQSQKNIQSIKNRYYNAVHYMDHLFGKAEFPKDAIVVFTGDHGEEFFDHGHLFHNSHLTKEQTSVPLYFKFGEGEKKVVARNVISQMDIFPSIIDYLGGKIPEFLEGNSLFQTPKFPFAITARFNAGCTPYEFFIHNGIDKLILQFSDRKQIWNSKNLEIISLRTKDDQSINTNNVNIWVNEKFGSAFKQLFNSEIEVD